MEVTVLSEGKSGILGLGSEEARIRVTPLSPMPDEGNDVAGIAQGILEDLLDAMGLQAYVARQSWPFVEQGEEAKPPIAFNISGDDLGILIGRRGQTLTSLQYIVRLIMAHKVKSWEHIIIDVEGYRQRRDRSLRALAMRMAGQVADSRMPFTLEPMPAYERRIIHITLADHFDVTTESVGIGESRKVVITPSEK